MIWIILSGFVGVLVGSVIVYFFARWVFKDMMN